MDMVYDRCIERTQYYFQAARVGRLYFYGYEVTICAKPYLTVCSIFANSDL